VALIYVDCNRMLDLTDQGLYEVILRAIKESVRDFGPELQAKLESYYHTLVQTESSFDVRLNFENALQDILDEGERDIVLLLDEFDEAFASLDGRVFLNLRAFRDRYRPRLAYVTANVRHLGTFRTAADVGEFVELSAAHTHVLGPLEEDASRQVIMTVAESRQAQLTDEELSLLVEESGGHPGLIDALTRALLRTPDDVRESSSESLQEAFDNDLVATEECVKLWRQLLLEEQETSLQLVSGSQLSSSRLLRSLLDWGLVAPVGEGDSIAFFGTYFERFLHRQTLQIEDIPAGLVVDADAGDVWVDGLQVPPLTDLEFRLLLSLHERLGKVTDKYQIVEAVWGSEYIDTVDDSRIEKLVSRLRSKLEPNPSDPQYLTTVRGRGYRLVAN
jgi:DNA-binding winged helix-turn-helix (wHTH) protein